MDRDKFPLVRVEKISRREMFAKILFVLFVLFVLRTNTICATQMTDIILRELTPYCKHQMCIWLHVPSNAVRDLQYFRVFQAHRDHLKNSV